MITLFLCSVLEYDKFLVTIDNLEILCIYKKKAKFRLFSFPAEPLAETSGRKIECVAGVPAIAIDLIATMTESSAIMTSSLPNMELSNADLDKLSDRLGKFKSPSRLPKPEIQPKPAHLVAQLAKHKVPSPVSNHTTTNTTERGEF